MHVPRRHTTVLIRLALALCLLLAGGTAAGEPDARVDATIRHLIGQVAGSGLTFVRNDSEYTPAEAAGHMQKKYRHFQDDIATAEDFIELCASRSLMSGEPYLVIDAGGRQHRTGDWLRTELTLYRDGKP